MKSITGYTLLLGLSLAATSCTESVARGDEDAVIQSDLDNTTTYFAATEASSASLYYKPAVGYVGDPMPFYDPVSQTFQILYLEDLRNSDATIYHPIYQLTTANAASYSSYGETIPCGGASEDDPAIGTGSVAYDEATGIYYAYYTGHKAASPSEVILRATSTDCKTWTKDRSFRLQAPDNYDPDNFRDPYVFYDSEAGLWRMVIAAIKDDTSVLAQFTSTDLKSWTEADVFFHNKWGRFYECPDVFQMGDYWYLVYSDKDIVQQVQYFYAPTLQELMNMGDDPEYPENEGKLEANNWGFYAGKTASDGTNRYIWGWCTTRSGDSNEADGDWAGALVAHKVVQSEDGTLGFTYPDAVYNNFSASVTPVEKKKSEGVSGSVAEGYTLAAGQSVSFGRLNYRNCIEMTVTTTPGASVFGLGFVHASDRDYDYSCFVEDKYDMLKFDKATWNESGNTDSRDGITEMNMNHSSDGVYHLTVLSDQSVCVVYINGKYAFTNRIYGMQRNPWSIFCTEGEVTISDLRLGTY